jgi:integrase
MCEGTTGSDMFLIKKAEKPKNHKDTLTKAEIKKLFKATSNNLRDHAIMMLFYYSSQRGGTIEFIDRGQIDFEGEINPKDGQRYHKIENIHAKNDFVYNVWVETECIDAIKRYLAEREEPKEGFRKDNYRRKKFHKDAIFLYGNGKRLTSPSMRNMMKRYGAKIHLKKNIYNHLWRTSTVTIMDGEGMSLAEIMNRTGHTNVESLTPYLQPNVETSNKKSRNALSLDKPKPEPKTETKTPIPPSKPKIDTDKKEEKKQIDTLHFSEMD